MEADFQTVLSASRRTDIPAFYMPWFMDQIENGAFEVSNPYTHKTTTVLAEPGRVHTIVFWSKDFGPFLNGQYGMALQKKGFHLFFNFTVNSENSVLEPSVPPLSLRLNQLTQLCERFGPQAIQWRFDPICHYQDPNGIIFNNLKDFILIGEIAASVGIKRCVTSFMDPYRKVLRRAESSDHKITFIDPDLGEKIEILQRMRDRLSQMDMELLVCCEKDVLSAISDGKAVSAGSCIPNNYLMNIYGGRLSLQKDRGQRLSSGCGCMVSRDIGSYELHPCGHRCLYCYANPGTGTGLSNDGIGRL